MTLSKWLAALTLSIALFAGAARAQTTTQYGGQGIPVTDPATFSQSVALETSRDGMTALRRTLQRMLGTERLNSDIEVSIVTLERWLADAPSQEITKLEDVSLAGTLRRIYYLNTFEGRLIFTRYDFTRTPSGWMLTGLTFGSSWNTVNANPLTPGWTVTQ
jgi:hypothetical protein